MLLKKYCVMIFTCLDISVYVKVFDCNIHSLITSLL